MWAASALIFLMNPLVGGVLLLSAAITQYVRVRQVDSEYAKRGELPPTARLVEAWLNRQKNAGKAPADATVKPYGSRAYAKQRWSAFWEDLGDKHREARAEHKQATANAQKRGEPAPPKPSTKEALRGWSWSIGSLIRPVGEKKPEVSEPVPDTATTVDGLPDGPRIACDVCGTTLLDTPTGWRHPDNSTCRRAAAAIPEPEPAGPPALGCPRCGGDSPVTAAGWCEPCTTSVPHGFCRSCRGAVRIRNGVWCHGPRWRCREELPISALTGTCGSCLRPHPLHPSMKDHSSEVRCGRPDCEPDIQNWDANRRETVAQAAELRHLLGNCESTQLAPGDVCQRCLEQERRDRNRRTQTGAGQEHDTSNRNTNDEENTMPAAPTQQSGEVTGIPSAVNYLTKMAEAHRQHADNEGIIASLARFNVGADDLDLVRAAMTASLDAAEMYADAAKTIDDGNAAVRQGYASAPNAADKHAQMAE